MVDKGIVCYRRLGRGAGLLVATLLAGVAACSALAPRVGSEPSPAVPAQSATGQWTGLQWRDVTVPAGGFFRGRAPLVGVFPPDPAGIVAWRGGVAMVGGDDRSVWTSKDGLSWSPSPGAPKYAGLVGWNGMLVAGGFVNNQQGLWTSTDANVWHKAPIRFDTVGCGQGGECLGLAAGPKGILAVTTEGRVGLMDPGTPWLSTDGVSWTPHPFPQDANQVSVHAFRDGFIAVGSVPLAGAALGNFVPRAWRSVDGIRWSVYRAVRPGVTTNDQWPYWGLNDPWSIVEGSLGVEDGGIHSTDGETWVEDSEYVPGSQLVSDGTRIVAAQTWLSRFFLSEGDGRWRELEQGGDIGQLPSGGHVYMLPRGLLWVTKDRIFLGEALSGIHPNGSLAPVTPSPTPRLEPS
jgi:hypothetical protein